MRIPSGNLCLSSRYNLVTHFFLALETLFLRNYEKLYPQKLHGLGKQNFKMCMQRTIFLSQTTVAAKAERLSICPQIRNYLAIMGKKNTTPLPLPLLQVHHEKCKGLLMDSNNNSSTLRHGQTNQYTDYRHIHKYVSAHIMGGNYLLSLMYIHQKKKCE